MAEAKFTYEGQDIIIQCTKNQKMKDICTNLSNKINVGLNSLVFLYGGGKLNLEKTFQELTKENRICILVDKYENEEICPKCGRILSNDIINELVSSNNNVNSSLKGIRRQIETIIADINNKEDTNDIINQLKNVNVLINNINEDIKKMNNKLNTIKLNFSNDNVKTNDNDNKKEEILKNEITCVYNKQEDEIDLLHDYTEDTEYWDDGEKKAYIEGKNNINDKNIDICINDKKIKFNYKYKSNEKGNIQVKFVFKKLLTSTAHMFGGCSSLQSINLSSFNTTNVENMIEMFFGCSSLQSINLSSFNTTNVKDMRYMFWDCSSLQSIDLSSFNTTSVKYMMSMFNGCSSLKKENVKISESGKKLLDEECWY